MRVLTDDKNLAYVIMEAPQQKKEPPQRIMKAPQRKKEAPQRVKNNFPSIPSIPTINYGHSKGLTDQKYA